MRKKSTNTFPLNLIEGLIIDIGNRNSLCIKSKKLANFL